MGSEEKTAESGVVKATVSLTVYLPADEADTFLRTSLENILYEIDEGDWIGSAPVKGRIEPVAKESLRAELEEIGNDGSFFDDLDGEDLEGDYGP